MVELVLVQSILGCKQLMLDHRISLVHWLLACTTAIHGHVVFFRHRRF